VEAHKETGQEYKLGYGLLAAAFAILLIAFFRILFQVRSPIEVLLDRLLTLIPMRWFEFLLGFFDGYAKPFAYVVAVLVAIVGGGLFLLIARFISSAFGTTLRKTFSILCLALAILVAILVLSLGSSPSTLALTLGAVFVYYAGVQYFVSSSQAPKKDVADSSRRRFLRQLGATVVGVAAAGIVVSVIQRLLSQATITSTGKASGNMPEPFTPNDEFYVVSKNILDPNVDSTSWKLRIGGLVQKPFELTLDEIKQLPPVEQDQTLECISNPVGGVLISNAKWKGIRLRDLLEQAQVREGVIDIKFTCADGYTESIPLEKAMEPTVLLAYEMNGEQLPSKHGSPLRLLVPNIFGMKNVKWVERIEAVNEDYKGYWQQQGWSDIATIQTMSQIRVPASNSDIQIGEETEIAGIAFAGSRGINKVEVSTDGGKTWQTAQLDPEIGPLCWRFWRYRWTPESEGYYTLVVRAQDGEGNWQTEERQPTLPSGATGYHSIQVRVTGSSQ